jgi:hypothetical protein
MSLSKKLRFDIFKRDSFTCQYCGKTPPMVVLEVDHILPKASGGKDEIDNLTTSCFDCNRGKGSRELSTLPQKTSEKMELMAEKEEQYIAFKRLQKKVQKRIEKEILEVEKIYSESFPDWCFSESFKLSVKKFINNIGLIEVKEAMIKACARCIDDENTLKYFCGICWNKIRGDE